MHSRLPVVISWNPSAMDLMPDAHALFTVYAGTSCGMPLRMEIWRAGLGPPPACRALPKIVSSTCCGCTPARSSAAFAATTPMSTAESETSEPPNLPIGVRTAERMYTLFTGASQTFQSRPNAAQLYRVEAGLCPAWTGQSPVPTQAGRARDTLLGVNILYGINTVTEALKARGRNFEWVAVAKERKDIRLQRAIDECRKIGVPVRVLSRMELDEIAGNAAHQGLVAATSAKQYSDLDDLVASRRGEQSLIVVLDGVEDPHNLGAILRTADAAGADGVVIPERRSAAVTGAVAKVSAGASEHLPVAKVTNISRALEELKEKDLWIVGLDERGGQTYDAVDYKMNCAIVLGAEGKGLHDLVRKHCDFLVSIPMLGKVPSLNVSVAAGVVLYEVVRQRRQAASKKV